MIYLIKWALSLTLLYSLYGLTLRRETLHTLNRAVLVGILVLSAMLPLFPVRLGHETWLSQSFEQLEESLSTELAAHRVSGHESHSSDILQTQPYSLQHRDAAIAQSPSCNRSIAMLQAERPSPFTWGLMFLGLYLLGAVVCWLAYLRSLIMVMRLIRRSRCIEERDGVRILLCPELRNSCSWMWWVMLAPEDRPTSEGPVFTHELAHVRLGHSWDKILAEITCRTLWFVPFAWMLREDLSDVHEYEADRAVLQTGIDIREYNQLLILKAVRPGLQPVVNAFNQSRIKKRITMMYKRKSNKWCAAKALYLLPMGLMSLMAFAKPVNQVSSRFGVPTEETVRDESTYRLDFSKPAGHAKKMVALDAAVLVDGEPATPVNGNWLADIDLNNVTITKDIEGNITRVNLRSKADNDSIYDVVEMNAGFLGGDAACYEWLSRNIRYPAEAVAKKIQGRVLVQFIVEKDGRITHPKVLRSPDKILSDEALRVVNLMPVWTPGKIGNKTVRTHFNLPIMFQYNQK